MKYPFRNMVFEGGGVKGIAYVGALQELQGRKILPKIKLTDPPNLKLVEKSR